MNNNSEFTPARAYLDKLRHALDERASPSAAPDMTTTLETTAHSLTPPDSSDVEPPKMRFAASSAAEQSQLAPKAIASLWSRFSHIYGLRWESAYGPALNDKNMLLPIAGTWAKALAACSPEDLARGLHACLDRPDGWPPTLPEFRALCKAPKISAAYHAHFAQIEETDEQKAHRREIGKKALLDIRQKLGMGMQK